MFLLGGRSDKKKKRAVISVTLPARRSVDLNMGRGPDLMFFIHSLAGDSENEYCRPRSVGQSTHFKTLRVASDLVAAVLRRDSKISMLPIGNAAASRWTRAGGNGETQHGGVSGRVLADFDSQVIPMGERPMVTTGDSNDRLQIASDARYLRVGTPDMSAAMKNTR